MQTQKFRLHDCHLADSLVVVIDVIRAFTTAAHAFASGVEKIILVGEIDEAFHLHKTLPNSYLAGEQEGIPIPGFHFGNSPIEMSKTSLNGKTLIFRTSSGTQGVVKSTNAEKILVSSFAIAEATLSRIKALSPKKVSFIVTGRTNGGHEDLALADYLESRLLHPPVDAAPYISRVRNSSLGLVFSSGKYPHFDKNDLEAACTIDSFNFALEVFREDGLHVLRPSNVFEKKTSK